MSPCNSGFTRLSASLIVAGCFVSCQDSDPGLQEKISLIEAELRDRESQLANVREELREASKPSAPTEASGPDIDAARSSYSSFIDTFRKTVAAEMPDVKIERTSVFPIEGPDPAKPIVSKVAFRVVGKNGRSGEMIIPLFADPSGKWQEPDTSELASFKIGLEADPQVAAKTPNPPQQQQKKLPNDVMGAKETIVVQWDDAPAPRTENPQQGQPAPQPPAPQPAAPKLPPKVMPTTRDVIIDFE